mmetsp:Transcript_7870/g.19471  ORF Transcript_7870/g.19471 Transcript_7870/m.19471 type:complete len:275 (-) Transcript_7870:183-1007(-)
MRNMPLKSTCTGSECTMAIHSWSCESFKLRQATLKALSKISRFRPPRTLSGCSAWKIVKMLSVRSREYPKDTPCCRRVSLSSNILSMRKNVRKLTLTSLLGSMPKAMSMSFMFPEDCQYWPFNNSTAFVNSSCSRSSLISSSKTWNALRISLKCCSDHPLDVTYCLSRSRCMIRLRDVIRWQSRTNSSQAIRPEPSSSMSSMSASNSSRSSTVLGVPAQSSKRMPISVRSKVPQRTPHRASKALRKRSWSYSRKPWTICKNSLKPIVPSDRLSS